MAGCLVPDNNTELCNNRQTLQVVASSRIVEKLLTPPGSLRIFGGDIILLDSLSGSSGG
jgi:hypothetical protein